MEESIPLNPQKVHHSLLLVEQRLIFDSDVWESSRAQHRPPSSSVHDFGASLHGGRVAETILQPQVFTLRVVIYMLTILRWPTPCRCGVRALVFGCCPPFQVRLGRIKRSVFLSPYPITAIPPRRCDGAPPRPQGSECAAGRRACRYRQPRCSRPRYTRIQEPARAKRRRNIA